jgi:patatin-like phospholipase/acyl hydrolase
MSAFTSFFSKSNSKRVLSFDGGGVRAIAGLVFLHKLEVESGKKIADMFDMFVGVSAGALNALCLGVNQMSAKEIKDYWSKDYIEEITSSNYFWDKASIIQARPKYENTGRIEVLKKNFL